MKGFVSITFAAFFLLTGCLGALGSDNETATQAQTNCDSEYDSCVRVHFDEMPKCQDTIPENGEPSWREYSETEHERSDGETITVFTVELDASEFHQGIMRRNPNTGNYSDEDEFFRTRNKILGVNPDTLPNDHRVLVRQTGKTQKIAVDEEAETVTKLPSSGDFLIDALTNPSGEIVVNGDTVYSVPDSSSRSTTQSKLTTAKSSLRTGFSAGNWSADIAIGKAFVFIGVVNARSKVHNFKRNGKGTRTECNFLFFGCDKKVVNANRMNMAAFWLVRSNFYTCVDEECSALVPRGFDEVANTQNNDKLKMTYYSTIGNPNINRQCATDTVCDGGACNSEHVFTQRDGSFHWESTVCANL